MVMSARGLAVAALVVSVRSQPDMGGAGGMPDMGGAGGMFGAGGAAGMDMASMMGGMGGMGGAGGAGGMDMASMMGGMGGGMGGGPGGGAPPEDPFPPVKTDVKFIACSMCKALARRLAADTGKWGKATTESEEAIRGVLTETCAAGEPGTPGAWLRELDMVVSKDGNSIDLKRLSSAGECKVKCKTIELACKAVLQEAEIDLAVGLYKSLKKGAPMNKKALTERLCTAEDAWAAEVAGSCTGKAPKVPESRKTSPPFKPTIAPVAEKKAKGGKKKKKPPAAAEGSAEL